jgi:two-component system chemotaxis response regulator CheB
MGKDGTEGIKKIKSAGGYTIAQDESSCVIFGMPKSAFDSGAIRQVLALPEIPGFIVSCLS